MMNQEIVGLINVATKAMVPLMGVAIDGVITGRAAKVKIRQKFCNTEDKPIEAVYKFPLPESAAVCGFRAQVGDRLIKGQVEEREKAFALYDNALARGDGAYLLDQERPNIFTLSVGNLPPQGDAVIEIEYVQLLNTDGPVVRFFLPTTISPRYVPQSTPDENGIPVTAIINPEFQLNVPYGLELRLEIAGKDKLAAVASPSHHINTAFESDSLIVSFTEDKAALDRDLVITMKYKDNFTNRGYMAAHNGARFVQVDFTPDMPGRGKTDTTKEICFLLDCSGSMQGDSIEQAKKALAIFLHALTPGAAFNIYRFGSSFNVFSPHSLIYSTSTLAQALSYLDSCQANLGGTELLAPLKAIYGQQPLHRKFERNVILITDGEVGNEQEILDMVAAGRPTRLFTVGIGHGPNEYLVKQMARLSGGASVMIAPGERIEPAVLGLFQKVGGTAVTDLTLDLGSSVEIAPVQPVIFSGESITLFARVSGTGSLPEKLTLTGRVSQSAHCWEVPLNPFAETEWPLPALWARQSICDLEECLAPATGSRQAARKDSGVKARLVQLSRDYGVICRETSFIAVETREHKGALEEIALRNVPVMLTRGWGGIGNLVEYSRLAQPLMKYMASTRLPRAHKEWRLQNEAENDAHSSLLMERKEHNKQIGASSKTGRDGLYYILTLQHAEGGFTIDTALSSFLGISMDDLKKKAATITIPQGDTTDCFLLLSTAIVMRLLETRYASRQKEWGHLVQKSRRWLEETIKRTQPTLGGKLLEEWGEDFISKVELRLNCVKETGHD
jgi:Ca-activated chloride channel family protein